MREQGDLVLRAARDVVLFGHLLAGLAHRHSGRALGDRRRHGGEIARPEARQPIEALADAARPRERDELLRRAPGESDRHVGERLGATGEDDLGFAAQNRLRAAGDGAIGRSAGEVDRRPGDRRRQRSAEDDLAPQIRRARRRDDDAEDGQVDLGRIDPRASDDLGGGDPGQIDDIQLLEVGAGARERRAAGGNDRHPARGAPQLLARNAQDTGRRPRRRHGSRPDRVGAQLHLDSRRGVVRLWQRRGWLAQVWGFRHRSLLRRQVYTKARCANGVTPGEKLADNERQRALTCSTSPAAGSPSTRRSRSRSARCRNHL